MDEKDLPSSDDSDADFVPKEEDKSDSGSEVTDCETSEGEDDACKIRKRRKGKKGNNKKIKSTQNEEIQDEESNKEEKKIDIDALWADFKSDVDNKASRKTVQGTLTEEKNDPVKKVNEGIQNVDSKNATNKPRGAPNFTARSRGGGLSKVLNQIGKKDKMSTLQKSQLDWNNFKKNEGIEEEIKSYNRGKDGYLEKQDFLQRTDLRQFEIEKDLRSASRKFLK